MSALFFFVLALMSIYFIIEVRLVRMPQMLGTTISREPNIRKY